MEDEELLKELDSVLQPAISRSWATAKRNAFGADPSDAFLDIVQVEIDNTRVDLSNILQKIDLSVQNCGTTSVERAASDFNDFLSTKEQKLPEVDSSNYMKETERGLQVWDGTRWVTLSKQANVKIEVFQDIDNDFKPAVRVWAKDTLTNTEVLYIDNDILAPGWDLSITRTGNFEESLSDLRKVNPYWEAPLYNISKNSVGVGGMVAGALEIRHVGNLTPWRTGDAFKNAKGWYRNKEGLYEKLSKQKGRGGGGYQKSARRAAGKSGKWSKVGKKFFFVGVAFSGYQMGDAIINDDTNKGEVITKASLDIVIGAIGVWGGPIGWAVAGTYFILDVSGAFGDWGTPSGISQSDYDAYQKNLFQQKYGDRIRALEFDVEYKPTFDKNINQYLFEESQMKIDNTRVATPKIIFEKF